MQRVAGFTAVKSVTTCIMTGNPYTGGMSNPNVTPIFDEGRMLRRARGRFVKDLIDADDRSVRYVALRIGVSPTTMGERVAGKSPFLADELEEIAAVLKIDPVDFYTRYIAVTGEGPGEPNTRSNGYKLGRSVVSLDALRERREGRSA